MNIDKLTGAELDLAVAHFVGCNKKRSGIINDQCMVCCLDVEYLGGYSGFYSPSTNNQFGGRLIDKYKISTVYMGTHWEATVSATRHKRAAIFSAEGPTRLIAAMRCILKIEEEG